MTNHSNAPAKRSIGFLFGLGVYMLVARMSGDPAPPIPTEVGNERP